MDLKKRQIIALSGKCGAGKDLAGQLLQQHFKCGEIIKYADALKRVCAVFTKTTLKQNYENKELSAEREASDDDIINAIHNEMSSNVSLADIILFINEIGKEKRTLGQWQVEIGKCARKHFGDNFWVQCLKRRMNEDKLYIITDLRFKVELADLQTLDNVVTIRINGSEERMKSALKGRDPKDISEVDLDDAKFMYTVNNKSDNIEDLDAEIQKIF